jgi:hypothetical protein
VSGAIVWLEVLTYRSRVRREAWRDLALINVASLPSLGEVGKPAMAELVQGPPLGQLLEQLGGAPVGQPGPTGVRADVGGGRLAGR